MRDKYTIVNGNFYSGHRRSPGSKVKFLGTTDSTFNITEEEFYEKLLDAAFRDIYGDLDKVHGESSFWVFFFLVYSEYRTPKIYCLHEFAKYTESVQAFLDDVDYPKANKIKGKSSSLCVWTKMETPHEKIKKEQGCK